MGKSKDAENMRKEDWIVHICPFCRHALWGHFKILQEYIPKEEENLYYCPRCNSEFEMTDEYKLRLKRKGELVQVGHYNSWI